MLPYRQLYFPKRRRSGTVALAGRVRNVLYSNNPRPKRGGICVSDFSRRHTSSFDRHVLITGGSTPSLVSQPRVSLLLIDLKVELSVYSAR